MLITDPIYTANMTVHQRNWFYAEYQRACKDEAIGVLLAIFFGSFGIHHFYLHRNGLGVLYLLFSWTGIPTLLGWIECFFMPGRVRHYNSAQAMFIANQILATPAPPASASAPVAHCTACANVVESSAAFCRHCGAALGNTLNARPAV